jgi:hypothetical protein
MLNGRWVSYYRVMKVTAFSLKFARLLYIRKNKNNGRHIGYAELRLKHYCILGNLDRKDYTDNTLVNIW